MLRIAGHCCLGFLRDYCSKYPYNKYSRIELSVKWYSKLIISYGSCTGKSLSYYSENKGYEQKEVLSTNTNLAHFGGSHAVV